MSSNVNVSLNIANVTVSEDENIINVSTTQQTFTILPGQPVSQFLDVNSSIIPSQTGVFNLGSLSKRWDTLYAESAYFSQVNTSSQIQLFDGSLIRFINETNDVSGNITGTFDTDANRERGIQITGAGRFEGNVVISKSNPYTSPIEGGYLTVENDIIAFETIQADSTVGTASINFANQGDFNSELQITGNTTLQGQTASGEVRLQGNVANTMIIGNTTNKAKEVHSHSVFTNVLESQTRANANMSFPFHVANYEDDIVKFNSNIFAIDNTMDKDNFVDPDYGKSIVFEISDSNSANVSQLGMRKLGVLDEFPGIIFDQTNAHVAIGGIGHDDPALDTQQYMPLKVSSNSNVVTVFNTLNLTTATPSVVNANITGNVTFQDHVNFVQDTEFTQQVTVGSLQSTNDIDGTNITATQTVTGQLLNSTGNVQASQSVNGNQAVFNTSVTAQTFQGNLVAETANITGVTELWTANASNRVFVGDGTNNVNIQNGIVQATGNLNAAAFYVTGDSTIVGNLEVQGNIDYVNVVDLLVDDQSITLNYGNATARDAFIYVDRSGSALNNAALQWNETADRWEIYDGTSTYIVPRSTTDLAEGDNLYYTDARFDTRFATKTTTDLTEGANLYYTTDRANSAISAYTGSMENLTGNITTTANIQAEYVIANNEFLGDLDGAISTAVFNDTATTLTKGKAVYLTGGNQGDQPHVDLADNTDPAKMPALGIVKENIGASSEGQVVTSGVMNFSSHGFTQGADLYVDGAGLLTETIPTGEANLIQKIGKVVSQNHIIVQGAFRTNATPNLDEGNIFLGSSSDTAVSVTPDSNFDTTGNTFSLSNALSDVNKIDSETDTAMVLYGEAGIELNQKVDSTESRIIDINTDGYAVTNPTLPADFTQGSFAPSFLTNITTTAGTNTVTISSPIANPFVPALRGPTFQTGIVVATFPGPLPGTLEQAVTTAGTNFGSGANGLYNPAAGLYGQKYGWYVLTLSSGLYDDIFPVDAYVTDIIGNTVYMSENAIATVSNAGSIFIPGMAQTTDSNTQLKYQTTPGTSANSSVDTLYGRLGRFVQSETLANLTYDKVSYGNTSTVSFTDIGTKNISDFEGSDESATRFKRSLLIGASATPDPISATSGTNNPSALGVILESDGETFTGNNAPAPRFLVNNYTGAFDDNTVLPSWGIVGATANVTADLNSIKSPQFNFRTNRGVKSTFTAATDTMQAGEIVGKINWGMATTGLGYQGIDYYNSPAAITVDVGDANITSVANTYMHITTTPAPSTNGYYRNMANIDSGANQQTNFTTKGGNVTIAAQTNGMISLAPTPDYGDGVTPTTTSTNELTWTRYPGSTHEYHRFMDVGFNDKGAKTGTLVVVQPASGATSGSTISYDSKGNATIRLQTHLANSDARYNFDIIHDESSENLVIASDPSANTEHVRIESSGRVNIKQVMKLNPLSNTAILALTGNEVGDMVYGSDANRVCYYDGTNWVTIDTNTAIV